ncbi:MAG: polyphenol oxidase family protein [Deltaproteobacteria bacterium]|nr:polyphenol oxidase family protein [Deltaproteobacteria bacterium]
MTINIKRHANTNFYRIEYNGFTFFAYQPWWDQRVIHGFANRSLDVSNGNFLESAGIRDCLHLHQQIHSDIVIDINTHSSYSAQPADGWFINDWRNIKGIFGIKTADCVPVLIKAGSAMANLHAGWQGVVNGILDSGWKLVQSSSCSRDEVEVLLGPSAQGCCYEIGQDLVDTFQNKFATLINQEQNEHSVLSRVGNKTHIDLKMLIKAWFISLGILPSKIHDLRHCTICDLSYFSYRREHNLSGRQLTFISNLEPLEIITRTKF